MFQFPRFASLPDEEIPYTGRVGSPIQTFADHIVQTNPRNLSQFITSFIASKSQGIPHTPLFVFYLESLKLDTNLSKFITTILLLQ